MRPTGLVPCRQGTIQSVNLDGQLPFTHAGQYGFQRYNSMPVLTDATFIASEIACAYCGSDREV